MRNTAYSPLYAHTALDVTGVCGAYRRGMRRDRTLSWFSRLDRAERAALLANPHGYVPSTAARRIAAHTTSTHRGETRQLRWLLKSFEANRLEDERHRLDDWWARLAPDVRADLVDHRSAEVPRAHREAVLDLMPGGVRQDDDLERGFPMPDVVTAYLDGPATLSRSPAACPTA